MILRYSKYTSLHYSKLMVVKRVVLETVYEKSCKKKKKKTSDGIRRRQLFNQCFFPIDYICSKNQLYSHLSLIVCFHVWYKRRKILCIN